MKPLSISILVFISVIALTQYLAYQRYLIAVDSEHKKIVTELNTVKERLKVSLSYSLSATKTLAFLVKEYGVPVDFDAVAKEIIESNKYIDALELTKGGEITHVYPQQGNEGVIGYNILEDSRRNQEAYKAIEKRELFFAGPFELKQGGVAVVGRLPIFTNDNFFGFSVVLIKLSTLLKAAGLDNLSDKSFYYQLSKINPQTGKEEFFLPDIPMDQKEQPISIEVPDGEWKLYVMPKEKDGALYPVFIMSGLGFILSLISSALAWNIAQQPQKLKHLVTLKTNEIVLEKNLSVSIINSLPGIFYLYNRAGKFARWNTNFEAISGYDANEISGMHPLDFFDADEKLLLEKKINEVFVKGEGEVTAHFYTKDRKKIPYYFNGRRTNFNGVDYLIGMGIDITERVNAEKELLKRTVEIQELTDHLERIREEERTRMAREIHDELGQQLTGLKIDALLINKRIQSEDQVVKDKLAGMIALIDDTMKTVRRLASELRPGILDDLGIIAALEWQTLEFERRTGIKSYFKTSLKDFPRERELSTHIFRIYQEALTNIARHANASSIYATLEQKNVHVILTVKDNGQGFDMDKIKGRHSLGLVGMKERTRIIKGELAIESKQNQGTAIRLKIPVSIGHQTNFYEIPNSR